MNVTYLQNNSAILIEHMRMDGYSKFFIKLCNTESRVITVLFLMMTAVVCLPLSATQEKL